MTQDIAKAMREGMRRLAAGVCVATTTGVDGKPYAMTVTSVTSVSDAPASLLVCVNQSARIHEHLSVGRSFAINVLGQNHKDVSIACSTGEQAETRFLVGDWSLAKTADDEANNLAATGLKSPLLSSAQASFECDIQKLVPYGTHTIVIGDIKSVQVNTSSNDPLVYHNGAYAQLRG